MYFILYKDNSGEWCWTLRAASHETICISSQGYPSKQAAQASIELVKADTAAALIYEDITHPWSEVLR